MSKFYEYAPSAVTEAMQEVVSEGWGYIAAWAFTGWIGALAVHLMSDANVNKLLKIPALQKYIKGECDKIFAKEKKADKSVTPEVKINDPWFTGGGTSGIHAKNAGYIITTVDKWHIIARGDTDHIEYIDVVLYYPSKDKHKKHAIPAPTKQELRNLGFREEDH